MRGEGAPAPAQARADATLFAVAWSVTRDVDRAVDAVHAGRRTAGDVDWSTLLAAVVTAAVDLAPATAVLPLGVLEAALDADGAEPLVDSLDLAALAANAAGVLDPFDRAVLELAGHQGLGGIDLARALDRVPGTVAADMAAARDHAEQLVGSALFARLARASCIGLDAALAGLPADPAAVDVAARVATHVADCETCADRRRALAPVANLLAGTTAPDPPTELLAHDGRGRRPRFRLPVARRGWWRLPLVALALVALGTAGLVVVSARATAPDEARAATLDASTTSVGLGSQSTTAPIVLHNSGPTPVSFDARSGAPWLTVRPRTGRIAAGSSRTLVVTLDRRGAPEGSVRTDVRVASDHGEASIPVSAVIEHPPMFGALTASPTGVSVPPCTAPSTALVSAVLVEESGLASVTVHWLAGTHSGSAPLASDGDTQRGTLGPFTAPGAVTWWVVATDTRGNTASSARQSLSVTPC